LHEINKTRAFILINSESLTASQARAFLLAAHARAIVHIARQKCMARKGILRIQPLWQGLIPHVAMHIHMPKHCWNPSQDRASMRGWPNRASRIGRERMAVSGMPARAWLGLRRALF
jgi:hypothetical protein